jgi:hypothetical protein
MKIQLKIQMKKQMKIQMKICKSHGVLVRKGYMVRKKLGLVYRKVHVFYQNNPNPN